MEDFKLLIWIVGIIGWLIYSFLTKKNRAEIKSNNDEATSSSNNVWDKIKNGDNIDLEVAINQVFGTKVTEPNKNQELTPTPKHNKTAIRPLSKPKQRVGSDTKTKAKTALESTSKTEGDLTSGTSITEDIDIRKAILYSEILKTKFDQ